MERVVLHVDANSFYASVEQAEHPELRGKPLSVGGDAEKRHGIVLASSIEAKRYGIKTGMAIWQAVQNCPDLVVRPADFERYMKYSGRMHYNIFPDYTDKVEGFGADEAWLDLSGRGVTLQDGEQAANQIRKRIWNELGITASVGVSTSKIMAKLASDMKKPNATTVITQEDIPNKVWPLPVSDLLFVGPSTTKSLKNCYINTIGDLAKCPDDFLSHKFGIKGAILKAYALGIDTTPVRPHGVVDVIKSVGNSATLPRDAKTREEVIIAIHMLAESVASRLRDNGFLSKCITFAPRDTELHWITRQKTIGMPTALATEIANVAIHLFDTHCVNMLPLRSLGVSCSSLVSESTPFQLDLMTDNIKREKMMSVSKAVDDIRRRFGHHSIKRGIVMSDLGVSQINPKDEHNIHPVPMYIGK